MLCTDLDDIWVRNVERVNLFTLLCLVVTVYKIIRVSKKRIYLTVRAIKREHTDTTSHRSHHVELQTEVAAFHGLLIVSPVGSQDTVLPGVTQFYVLEFIFSEHFKDFVTEIDSAVAEIIQVFYLWIEKSDLLTSRILQSVWQCSLNFQSAGFSNQNDFLKLKKWNKSLY